MERWLASVIVLASTTALAEPLDRSTLPLPAAEHASAPRVKMPTVPTFEVPAGAPGTRGVREMMLAGRDELGTDAQVSGYVIWIYSCLDAVRQPKESVKQAQKRIDDDPTLCERAKFYLGDTKDTALEQGLWVVDAPRQFNKMETQRIKKDQRGPDVYPDRCEPNAKLTNGYCFPIAVGDYVTVTGTWDVVSPHSERNSDGLLLFKSLGKAPAPTTVTMVSPGAATGVSELKAVRPVFTPNKQADPPMAKRKESQSAYADGIKAMGQKDYKAAMAAFSTANTAWPQNHAVLYAMGGVQMMQNDWAGASRSMSAALALQPKSPMYALMAGRAFYEQAIVKAKDAEAKKRNVQPASVVLDMGAVDTQAAEQMFRYALDLDKQLWRAHYYVGRISRDQGRAKEAATELSLALQDGPREAAPWIALAVLYRRWGRADLAQHVMEQGTQTVPDAPEASDAFYMLGMTHDDQRHDAAAVEAFSHALDLDAANLKVRYVRGRTLYRMKRYAEAKEDLAAYVAAPEHQELASVSAQSMLFDIATKPSPKKKGR